MDALFDPLLVIVALSVALEALALLCAELVMALACRALVCALLAMAFVARTRLIAERVRRRERVAVQRLSFLGLVAVALTLAAHAFVALVAGARLYSALVCGASLALGVEEARELRWLYARERAETPDDAPYAERWAPYVALAEAARARLAAAPNTMV